MAIGHKLRHTLKGLGRTRQTEGGPDAPASSPAGLHLSSSTTPKADPSMPPEPTLEAPRVEASMTSDNDTLWEDDVLTTEADVEVDTLTHERMERIREQAAEISRAASP